ncbi:hypothetical protein ABK040_012699 [Willaertia magna]
MFKTTFKSKSAGPVINAVDDLDDEIHEDAILSLTGSDDMPSINDQWCRLQNYGFPEPAPEDDAELYEAYMKYKKSDKKDKTMNESTKAWKSFIDEHGGLNGKLPRDESTKKNIKSLVRKHPIPPWYRRFIWTQITGVDKKIRENKGYYNKILEVHNGQQCPNEGQIDLDLARTFPSHPFYSSPHSIGRTQMKNILTAFSWRNPYVSYCQSLNYIVGLFLLHCNEEESFWLLVTLLEDILPANYYNPDLTGMRVDSYVLDELVNDRLPKLAAHLKELGVETCAFASGWFMRIFIDVFPIETSTRILDLIFTEGTKILFRVALGYLKLQENELEQKFHMGEVLHYLNYSTRRMYDHAFLLKHCFSFYNFKMSVITNARDKYTLIVEKETQEMERRRKEMRKREETKRKQIEQQIQEEKTQSMNSATNVSSISLAGQSSNISLDSSFGEENNNM